MHIHNQYKDLKPFTKWVGGKSSSVPSLLEFIPEKISTYVEPFVGCGALFFSLDFERAIINDVNSELMNTYEVIRSNVGELEFYLSTLIYDRKLFEKIRAWDREEDFLKRPKVERAARFIYLMKTCYNGLYRVSRKNYFNTPFGNHTSPNICDVPTLNACSRFLNHAEVSILNQDYKELLDRIPEDAFVYLDPPYSPVSKTASFTSYQSEEFTQTAQHELYEFCMKLHERGIRFMLSNSDVEEMRTLYGRFNISELDVLRRVNSNTRRRNAVKELVITNYDRESFELKCLK